MQTDIDTLSVAHFFSSKHPREVVWIFLQLIIAIPSEHYYLVALEDV